MTPQINHFSSNCTSDELLQLNSQMLDQESNESVEEAIDVDQIEFVQENRFIGETKYKIYRPNSLSIRGVVSEAEYQILQEIFSKLARESYFQLFKQKGEIEKLKTQVFHIHPLNFLEAVKFNDELKVLFLQSIKKYFVRSQCISAFKEELKDQHKLFQNIQPHLRNFSKNMGIQQEVLNQFLVANKIDAMLEHILQKNT